MCVQFLKNGVCVPDNGDLRPNCINCARSRSKWAVRHASLLSARHPVGSVEAPRVEQEGVGEGDDGDVVVLYVLLLINTPPTTSLALARARAVTEPTLIDPVKCSGVPAVLQRI